MCWHWEESHEAAYIKLKDLVANSPVLRYFDPKEPLTLSVDASSKGLGAVILQQDKPIAYASRALTKTQQNYAQIEKETLAIAFGCSKFHEYIFGREVKVESDHKPLQSIFRKPLYQAPPRLQRILLTLQQYDLKVVFKPGVQLVVADTLSRAYLNETLEELDSRITVNFLEYLPISDQKYEQFKRESEKDDELQNLRKVIIDGWPNDKNKVSSELTKYWNYRDEISCIDGLLFKSHKLIVPKSLRREMLGLIHESHLGMVKCKSRARDTLFWPGMCSDIEQYVAECRVCAETQRSNTKEPMKPSEIPERPWSKIAVDLCEIKGQHYLVSVDYYSKWPEIAKLDNLSSKNTIMYMKSQFFALWNTR